MNIAGATRCLIFVELTDSVCTAGIGRRRGGPANADAWRWWRRARGRRGGRAWGRGGRGGRRRGGRRRRWGRRKRGRGGWGRGARGRRRGAGRRRRGLWRLWWGRRRRVRRRGRRGRGAGGRRAWRRRGSWPAGRLRDFVRLSSTEQKMAGASHSRIGSVHSASTQKRGPGSLVQAALVTRSPAQQVRAMGVHDCVSGETQSASIGLCGKHCPPANPPSPNARSPGTQDVGQIGQAGEHGAARG